MGNQDTSKEELRKEIRVIMREWEGFFPFPEPDDAGEEARIAYETPKRMIELISSTVQEVLTRLEEKQRNYTPIHGDLINDRKAVPLEAITKEKERWK